jgi:hypothetical protein
MTFIQFVALKVSQNFSENKRVCRKNTKLSPNRLDMATINEHAEDRYEIVAYLTFCIMPDKLRPGKMGFIDRLLCFSQTTIIQ